MGNIAYGLRNIVWGLRDGVDLRICRRLYVELGIEGIAGIEQFSAMLAFQRCFKDLFPTEGAGFGLFLRSPPTRLLFCQISRCVNGGSDFFFGFLVWVFLRLG